MPDVNNLDLVPEQLPEGDWDAPEAGSFPPELVPGDYTFMFHLPADGPITEGQVIHNGQPDQSVVLQVNFEAEALSNGSGAAVPAREGGDQPRLKFQKASFFKSPKMQLSMGQDMLRSLALRIQPLTRSAVEQALKECDGRRTFAAEVIWRAYFKSSGVTVSTNPNRKRGEVLWPRDAEGKWQEMVTDGQSTEKQFGRAEIKRFKLPKATA